MLTSLLFCVIALLIYREIFNNYRKGNCFQKFEKTFFSQSLIIIISFRSRNIKVQDCIIAQMQISVRTMWIKTTFLLDVFHRLP